MKTKEEYLWEEVKELALTKFCCESSHQTTKWHFGEFSKEFYGRNRWSTFS